MIPLNSNLSALKRSPIRLFTNLARQTPGCASLTIGEPDFDTPEAIREAAVSAIRAGDTHYAPNQGTPALRAAVADFETKRGNATNPEQVLITIGACHALFTALLGILNPGEEIIVPTPGFMLYETIATIAGAKTVPLDISKTGFQIEEAALRALITDKAKAIIINSPCNPTGMVLNRRSLEAVKNAVLGKPIFVLCDNVYNRLVYTDCPDISAAGAGAAHLLCHDRLAGGIPRLPGICDGTAAASERSGDHRRSHIFAGCRHHRAGHRPCPHGGSLPQTAGICVPPAG